MTRASPWTLAKSRADALWPKLAKLHLTPPAKPVPGLVVRSDGIDITMLLGRDIPLDPGDHELVASAPGFADWKTRVTIGAAGTTPIELPVLERLPENVVQPAAPNVHEGTLTVVAQPGAEILVDSVHVGVGRFEGKLKSGGHTLRVVATGMRPYQSEIVVGDGEQRTIDVPARAWRAHRGHVTCGSARPRRGGHQGGFDGVGPRAAAKQLAGDR